MQADAAEKRRFGTEIARAVLRAPLKIGIRRLFASGQSPTGKIFGGYLQVATLKSSCIGLFAHSLKIHPIEFLEIPLKKRRERVTLLNPLLLPRTRQNPTKDTP
ncbi:MAG: hypothetical protein IKQ82_08315 [Lentisphaeria bacterium]|nr:hypothetical protein [Lentisphaeria bacterium]